MTANPEFWADAIGDELLIHCNDDWVHLPELAWIVRGLSPVSEKRDIVARACEEVRTLLNDRLIQLGTVTSSGFVPWELATADAVKRLSTEWMALSGEPEMGDVCWIATTPAGDAVAETILRRLGR